MGVEISDKKLLINCALISIIGVAFIIANIITLAFVHDAIIYFTLAMIINIMLVIGGIGIYRGNSNLWIITIFCGIIGIVLGLIEIFSVFTNLSIDIPKPELIFGIIDTVLSFIIIILAFAPPARKRCFKKFFTLD